jgi:hypothetical protein
MGPNIRQAVVKHVLAQASLTAAYSLSPHLSPKNVNALARLPQHDRSGESHFQDQSFHWHLSGLHFGDYPLLLDNGLTQLQASDAVTHIAFYAGWPSAPCSSRRKGSL